MSILGSFGGVLALSALPLLVAFPLLRRAYPHFGNRPFLASAAAGFGAVLPAAVVQGLLPADEVDPFGLAARSFLLVALSEEGAKFLLVRMVRRAWGGAAHGFAAGTAAGLGFAFVETALRASVNPAAVFSRALTAVPLHAACGGWVGRAAAHAAPPSPRTFGLLLMAVLVHGAYDVCLLIPGVNPLLPAAMALSALGLSIFSRPRNGEKAG